MKRQEFMTRMNGVSGPEYQTVLGYPLTFGKTNAFIYYNKDRRLWHVVEQTTGLAWASGDTKKEAIFMAQIRYEKYGHKIRASVRKALREAK